ncbi:hypothetical protein HPB50_004332 [Hyalomma asiaticum]|uniref:Uncharacterized protein n=1 Tax=Hyalomma asiaticum TaxID=266040 RepID=A0ACB7SJM8_HYAAI|nr:hypothetical protein HPB50_004332 [Hyalomma asiaticum]
MTDDDEPAAPGDVFMNEGLRNPLFISEKIAMLTAEEPTLSEGRRGVRSSVAEDSEFRASQSGDSHKQTRFGGGMRWPAQIADCFGEVCLQVRRRAQVATVAGTFPSTPRTYVVRERTALTTRTSGCLPNE